MLPIIRYFRSSARTNGFFHSRNRERNCLAIALVFIAFIGSLSVGNAATVIYQFTGGSMTPTVTGLPVGVSASNFSLGAFTLVNLQDNGGSVDALRISGNDASNTGTSGSFGANQVLTFSLTIPSDVTLNLTSLSLDFTSNGITGTQYSNTRIYTNLTSNNSANVTTNTIGILGRSSNGPTFGNSTISLATPDSNASNGTAVNNGMFDNLSNQTLTFYMPWVDSGTDATSYIEIDNLTLTFTPVPEPSSVLLGGLGALALLRRRRK